MGVNEFGSVLTFMELTLGARMDKGGKIITKCDHCHKKRKLWGNETEGNWGGHLRRTEYFSGVTCDLRPEDGE